MSTNPVPSGNPVSAAAAYMNSIDLLKYPELAQQIASVNQVKLNDVETMVLMASQAAQAKFLSSTVESGFSSASNTIASGAFLAGAGLAAVGASGFQIKASGSNMADISAAQTEKQDAMAALNSQKNAEENSIELLRPKNDGVELQDMATLKPKTSGSFKANGIKLKSEKDILSDLETKVEMARIKSNDIQNTGTLIQTLGQLLQFPSQVAQANSQVAQMQQQVMNNNYSAAQGSAQPANQTLQQILQFDPYAQNVASSRA